jgi:hypothetical protein
MAVAVLQMNPQGTKQQYDEVSEVMFPGGVMQNLPEGLIIHTAGPAEGGWYVYDVWESKEAFERFHQEKLGPAISKVVGEAAASAEPQYFEIESLIQPDA